MKAKWFALFVVSGLVLAGLVGCKSEETPSDNPTPPTATGPKPGADVKSGGTPNAAPAPPVAGKENSPKGSMTPSAAPTPTPASDKDVEVGGKTK